MIHRVLVGAETQVSELKKLVRKKLMTGGAVLRLAEELTAGDLGRIFAEFSGGAEDNGIQSAVLAEIAKHRALTPELKERLKLLQLGEVNREL